MPEEFEVTIFELYHPNLGLLIFDNLFLKTHSLRAFKSFRDIPLDRKLTFPVEIFLNIMPVKENRKCKHI